MVAWVWLAGLPHLSYIFPGRPDFSVKRSKRIFCFLLGLLSLPSGASKSLREALLEAMLEPLELLLESLESAIVASNVPLLPSNVPLDLYWRLL